MTLLDPRFTRFDGTQVTGRVPATVIVEGDFDMTPDQEVQMEHCYKLFRDALATSVGDFLVQNRVLEDGTEIRMESMQDRDTVFVKPAGGDRESLKLPHGFAVVTNWRKPRIYKRRLVWPEGETRWKFADDRVPQLRNENYVYDNQVFRVHDPDADTKKFFNLPMVLRKNVRTLWDWGRRTGSNAIANLIYPFRLKGTEEPKFIFRPAHYAVENKIVDAIGTVLYTTTISDQILLPDNPEPDEPIFLTPSTDAQGNQLGVQHMRYAGISPIFNIWKFRFCNERIERTNATTYALVERNVIDVITPVSGQTTTVTNINDAQMGEEIDARLNATIFSTAPGGVYGAGSLPDLGYAAYWSTGWTEVPQDLSGVPRQSSFEQALRNVVTQGGGSSVLQKLLVQGGQNAVEYIPLWLEINYPADIFWRGGEKATGIYKSDVFGDSFPPDGYITTRIHIKRYDTNYNVDGAPKITAMLGWKNLRLLEGTTTGRMSGREHIDITNQTGAFQKDLDMTFITRETYQTTDPSAPNFVQNPYIGNPGTLGAWLTAHNIRNTYWEALRLAKGTGFSGPNPETLTTLVHNERPNNTVGYNLVSRFVIDYDHKGQFYAAIRCEVTCSGATWVEDIAVYKGFMKKGDDPTYTVKIWFECGWGGVVGTLPDGLQSELLLVEETITRPMFEVIPREMFSPWYWPLPAYLDRSCIARVPPQPTIDENFMQQLRTLASHQGVNTNIAVQDIRTDMPETPETSSKEGVEYSWQHKDRVIPHEKFVTGQLYARTFKLSDFYEAFWMLYQLKVSAIQDNFQPPEPAPTREAWHYHPVIKAALAVTRHIEVRDGGIINWSDELPGELTGHPPAPAPRPPLTSRQIKLYRV